MGYKFVNGDAVLKALASPRHNLDGVEWAIRNIDERNALDDEDSPLVSQWVVEAVYDGALKVPLHTVYQRVSEIEDELRKAHDYKVVLVVMGREREKKKR